MPSRAARGLKVIGVVLVGLLVSLTASAATHPPISWSLWLNLEWDPALVRLWLDGAVETASLAPINEGNGWVEPLVFSPDGRLVAACAVGDESLLSLIVYDIAADAVLFKQSFPEAVYCNLTSDSFLRTTEADLVAIGNLNLSGSPIPNDSAAPPWEVMVFDAYTGEIVFHLDGDMPEVRQVVPNNLYRIELPDDLEARIDPAKLILPIQPWIVGFTAQQITLVLSIWEPRNRVDMLTWDYRENPPRVVYSVEDDFLPLATREVLPNGEMLWQEYDPRFPATVLRHPNTVKYRPSPTANERVIFARVFNYAHFVDGGREIALITQTETGEHLALLTRSGTVIPIPNPAGVSYFEVIPTPDGYILHARVGAGCLDCPVFTHYRIEGGYVMQGEVLWQEHNWDVVWWADPFPEVLDLPSFPGVTP